MCLHFSLFLLIKCDFFGSYLEQNPSNEENTKPNEETIWIVHACDLKWLWSLLPSNLQWMEKEMWNSDYFLNIMAYDFIFLNGLFISSDYPKIHLLCKS